jgi:diguanylate cyclase (GGDEF)-like protein
VKPNNPMPTEDAADDISVLVKTLRETDQRLEHLTAGEVDSVVDREGNSFLLRRAQDQLRESESARQAAILDALAAPIALLNASGTIVSVNEPWRRFAADNGGTDAGGSIGRNYLGVCDGTRGAEAADAQRAARGIRAVLGGKLRHFSCEYACHSHNERRWFLLSVTPMAHHDRLGAVLLHLNITDRKQGSEAVQRLATAMDAIGDGLFLVNRLTMRLTHANEAACRLYQLPRAQLLATDPWTLLATSRTALERSYDHTIAAGAEATPLEVPWPRADGTPGWAEVRCRAQHTAEQWTLVTLVRDVTERKEAQLGIMHLNRVYAMLSAINALIVRVRNRDELFQEVCQIAIAAGGFRMVWIAMLDDSRRKAVPVSWAGMDEELVALVRTRLADMAAAVPTNSLASRALTERRVVVVNEVDAVPGDAMAQKIIAAGARSMAVLPLIVADVPMGIMALYAGASDFFQESELRLLTELTGNVAFAIDHIEKQDRLDYLAYYDLLTGLANRSLFQERLGQYMRAASAAGQRLALLTLNVQRFRNINDSLGMQAGDLLLRQVADWLKDNIADANQLSRVDGDHFAVVLPGIAHAGNVTRILDKLIDDFPHYPFHLDGVEVRVAAWIGVALYPEDGADAEILFRNAEAALDKAKGSGERFLFYAHKMSEAVTGRLTLENQLRQALERGEFVLHYQPKISIADGVLSGAEALIRWRDPLSGLVPPARFIPILEETGLIHEVGNWALRQAIDDYLRWRRAGLPDVRIAVNVSPLQLRHGEFVAQIARAIAVDAQAPAGLELEITESLIMADIEHTRSSLQAIRALGVSMAIDDFGTGFSSLSYLARLPVDTLKVDRAFVQALSPGAPELALVSAIINLAHALQLKVVAEGVETEEQLRLLRLLDCDEAQGYLFSKPLSAEAFGALYLEGGPSATRA